MVLVLISAAASNMLLQDARRVRTLTASTQALYVAEAGISANLPGLEDDSTTGWTVFGPTSGTTGGETYDATLTRSGARWLLSSTATVSGISKTVSVELKNLYPEALTFAMASGGEVKIKSNQADITVEGDIHANGDMELKEMGGATLLWVKALAPATGRATASGSYDVTSGNVVRDGGGSGGADEIDMPTFNFGDFENVAQTQGTLNVTYFTSDQTFDGSSLDATGKGGLIFVDGEVTFTGTSTIVGGFVATGDIKLNNGAVLTQSHDAANEYPIFMCGGAECRLDGNFNTAEGNIIFATNLLKVRTSGSSASVLGCVIAGEIDILTSNSGETISIKYASIVADDVVSTGLEIIAWNR